MVKAAQQRNELESSYQLCPCRIEIAGIVANVLVVNPEGRRAVRKIFLGERFAVEDTAHIVGNFADGGVNTHVLQPGDVLSDDCGIGAVITAADSLHVSRLQQRLRGRALKRYSFRPPPSLVFHDDDMAVVVDNQGGVWSGGRCSAHRGTADEQLKRCQETKSINSHKKPFLG